MPRSFKWLLPSGFPTKTLYAPLLAPIRATRPACLSCLDLTTQNTHPSVKENLLLVYVIAPSSFYWYCAPKNLKIKYTKLCIKRSPKTGHIAKIQSICPMLWIMFTWNSGFSSSHNSLHFLL
jgi:hypothetical protein